MQNTGIWRQGELKSLKGQNKTEKLLTLRTADFLSKEVSSSYTEKLYYSPSGLPIFPNLQLAQERKQNTLTTWTHCNLHLLHLRNKRPEQKRMCPSSLGPFMEEPALVCEICCYMSLKTPTPKAEGMVSSCGSNLQYHPQILCRWWPSVLPCR